MVLTAVGQSNSEENMAQALRATCLHCPATRKDFIHVVVEMEDEHEEKSAQLTEMVQDEDKMHAVVAEFLKVSHGERTCGSNRGGLERNTEHNVVCASGQICPFSGVLIECNTPGTTQKKNRCLCCNREWDTSVAVAERKPDQTMNQIIGAVGRCGSRKQKHIPLDELLREIVLLAADRAGIRGAGTVSPPARHRQSAHRHGL